MIGPNRDKKPLPIGNSLFDSVIEGGYYYVDKTLFIKDVIDNGAKVTLCTRPRRFGKTLNQTMLQCFFEDASRVGGKDTRSLFNGLKIEAAGDGYMKHQGKYPVILLSLKEAGQENFADALTVFKTEIAEEFLRHRYVMEKIDDPIALEKFKTLSTGKGEAFSYYHSLKFLSKCLEDYYGKKAVVLIDEYDVPLHKSWVCGYYKEMADFVRSLFGSALKDNPHLEFSVITGCLRISKESLFTGLNHLAVVSVLSNNYSEYFGFTQNEVNAMLSYYELSDKGEIVRDWYNGYLFGKTVVYNPWSCLHVVEDWVTDINKRPRPHWVNTSGNDLLRDMIDEIGAEAKSGLETLIAGGTVSTLIHEGMTYTEIYDSPDNLWNFLFFTGYLKKVGESVDHIERIVVEMKIPNKEVHIIFEEKIKEWFRKHIAKKNLAPLRDAIVNGDAETFQNELSRLLRESISFMDSAENFYHGFMTGVLTGIDGYEVKSNRESGHGRSDIVMCGIERNDVVIFELKSAKEFDALPNACEEALKQIEEKKYAAYWSKEGYEDILKYGVGFYKKHCRVQKG